MLQLTSRPLPGGRRLGSEARLSNQRFINAVNGISTAPEAGSAHVLLHQVKSLRYATFSLRLLLHFS